MKLGFTDKYEVFVIFTVLSCTMIDMKGRLLVWTVEDFDPHNPPPFGPTKLAV